jgi:hypothetical protein
VSPTELADGLEPLVEGLWVVQFGEVDDEIVDVVSPVDVLLGGVLEG